MQETYLAGIYHWVVLLPYALSGYVALIDP